MHDLAIAQLKNSVQYFEEFKSHQEKEINVQTMHNIERVERKLSQFEMKVKLSDKAILDFKDMMKIQNEKLQLQAEKLQKMQEHVQEQIQLSNDISISNKQSINFDIAEVRNDMLEIKEQHKKVIECEKRLVRGLDHSTAKRDELSKKLEETKKDLKTVEKRCDQGFSRVDRQMISNNEFLKRQGTTQGKHLSTLEYYVERMVPIHQLVL